MEVIEKKEALIKALREISEQKKNDIDIYTDEEMLRSIKFEDKVTPLFGQSETHIMDELLKNDHKPEEEGGLTAIYGFYYQMLVFIEYMVEAMESKWTFLALEYHDDIIAGNEIQNTICFIQVKTSKRPAINITDSTLSVYNRTKSKQTGTVNGKVRNNSWIDKLFENSKFVKGLRPDLSFKLVTDYHIVNGRRTSIDEYLTVPRERQTIEEGDIYKNLKEDCYDADGNKINYKERYGLELVELLKKFDFVYKPKKEYLHYICSRFNKHLGQGLGIDENDIKWLIGELISRCAARQSGPILFFNQEDIEQYRGALETKAMAKANFTISNRKANHLINKALQKILNSISDCAIKEDLNILLGNYEHHLLTQLDEYLTIHSIIYRFTSGRRPLIGDTENLPNFEDDLVTFIKTSFLLYLINEEYNFEKSLDGILVKGVRESVDQDFMKICFLNLGLELNLDEGIDKLKELIAVIPEENQLGLLWETSNIFTIFHGDCIDEEESLTVEITNVARPNIPQMENYPMATDVTPIVTIVPEKPLKKLYSQIRRTPNISELKDKVQEIWISMNRSEN